MLTSYKYKKRSRNNNNNNLLLFFTESNTKDKKNDTKTLSNIFNKNQTVCSLKKSNKRPNNKNKKELYKKKLKSLLINIEKNEKKNIFKNKNYLFEKLSHDKEKIPKIKSQEQFNYYLINDFKENEPAINEIKKSLKNKKIDEEFEIYKSFVQEKQYYNNISLIKEYRRNKYQLKTESNLSINNNNNNNNKIQIKHERKSKKKLTYHKPVVFNNSIYQKYYKNKEKEIHHNHNINDSNKTMIKVRNKRKSVIFQPLYKNSKDFLQLISTKNQSNNNNDNIANISNSNSNIKSTEKKIQKKYRIQM
jgi:hypothetical protein